MKYHFIYRRKDNEYIGFITEKWMLKKLLEQRKEHTLLIHSVNSKDLDPNILHKLEKESPYDKMYINCVNGVDYVISTSEEIKFQFKVIRDTIFGKKSLVHIMNNKKYIRFNNEEDDTIDRALEIIYKLLLDITEDPDAIACDDYYDLTQWMKYILE